MSLQKSWTHRNLLESQVPKKITIFLQKMTKTLQYRIWIRKSYVCWLCNLPSVKNVLWHWSMYAIIKGLMWIFVNIMTHSNSSRLCAESNDLGHARTQTANTEIQLHFLSCQWSCFKCNAAFSLRHGCCVCAFGEPLIHSVNWVTSIWVNILLRKE